MISPMFRSSWDRSNFSFADARSSAGVLLEPVDHLLDLDALREVLVDGVVDEALLVPALSWRYLCVLGVALASDASVPLSPGDAPSRPSCCGVSRRRRPDAIDATHPKRCSTDASRTRAARRGKSFSRFLLLERAELVQRRMSLFLSKHSNIWRTPPYLCNAN